MRSSSASEDEVLARLTAARNRFATTVTEMATPDAQAQALASLPPDDESQYAGDEGRIPVRGSDIRMEQTNAEPERVEQQLADMRIRIGELDRVLAGRRINVASSNGLIRVVADIHGDILELEVDPAALRGHHVRDLGRSLVEVIKAARHKGAEEQRQVVQELFPEADWNDGGFLYVG